MGKPSFTCDVTEYGAVGDGTTDDTAAFKRAIAACIQQSVLGGVVYIPTGKYRLTQPLYGRYPENGSNYKIRPLTFRGDGKAHSRLLWESTQGKEGKGGLLLYGTGHSAEDATTVTVEGLSLSTNFDDAGTAIEVKWIKQDGSVYHDHSPLNKVRVDDVEVTSYDYHGSGPGGAGIGKWSKGLSIAVPWGVDLSHVTICVCTDAGIELVAPVSCIHFLSHIYINNCDTALRIRNTLEALYLSNFEFVSNRIGIDADVHSGPVYLINNGHIDSATDGAQPALLMAFSNAEQVKVSNVAGWVHKSAAATNLMFFGNCKGVAISNCTLTVVDKLPPSVNGIFVKNCHHVHIFGNLIAVGGLGESVLSENSSGVHIWP